MKFLLLLLFLINFNSVFSCEFENLNKKIPSLLGLANNNMTESIFNTIIQKVSDVFEPQIKERNGKLYVIKVWKNNKANALAQQYGSNPTTFQVLFFGGIARHPMMTNDAFALVVCHEFGHHLGGAPKRTSRSWSSVEGQADYWGSSKCLRNIFQNDDNIKIISNMNIDSEVLSKCSLAFSSNAMEKALCVRVAIAGISVAKTLNSFIKNAKDISVMTPSKNVVSSTNQSHPSSQCRLDTYINSSMCDIDEFGYRPSCWFFN